MSLKALNQYIYPKSCSLIFLSFKLVLKYFVLLYSIFVTGFVIIEVI